MAEHGHETHAPATGHGSAKEGSAVEKLPIIGIAIGMLKTIGTSEGLQNFLDKMKDFVVPIALKIFEPLGIFFGMEGGGSGGAHAPAAVH